MVCHSLLQWTTFCQTSPPWPYHFGWPHTAWLSLTELDKAVVLWSDWLVFCDYGFSVPALWCPLATPTVLFGFLLLGRGVSLHACSSKAQPLLLILDDGYLLTANPPDLEHGVVPLSPPAPCSSRSLEMGLLLSAAAPASLQPKMEMLYTVSKTKTGSWLWLRSWTPYCQIQT